MKKFMAIALITALVASLGLTGCSSDNEGAVQTENQTPEAGEEITIQFSYWGSPYEDEILKSIMTVYEEQNPNIKIEGIYIPNSDYTTKLTAMIASGDEPDISYLLPNDFYSWARQNRFVELYEMFEKDERYDIGDFLPNTFFEWEEGKCGAKNVANEVIQLYYNKDLFDQYEVDYLPSHPDEVLTWDAFVDICKTLTIDENGSNAHSPAFDPQRIRQYGFDFNKSNTNWAPFVYLNGGDVLTDDGTGLGLASHASAAALQRLGDLINVHHVAPNPVTASRANMSVTAALQSKQVAIMCDGTWTNLDMSQVDINYDVACLPKMDGDFLFTVTSSCMSIFNTTEHLEEAWDFFMFMGDPANAVDIYASGLWMPVLKDWYEDPELIAKWADPGSTGHTEGFYNSAILASQYPSRLPPEGRVKRFTEIDAQIESALETVWMGEDTAANAMASIEETTKPLIDGYYIIR